MTVSEGDFARMEERPFGSPIVGRGEDAFLPGKRGRTRWERRGRESNSL